MNLNAAVSTDTPWSALGHRLKNLRRSGGWTALAVAADIGLHHSRLSRIERGKVLPRKEELRDLLKRLDADENTAAELGNLYERLRGQSRSSGEFGERLDSVQEREWKKFIEDTRLARIFSQGVIPGLIQTPPYATEIFGNSYFTRTVARDEIDRAVKIRMHAQDVLFDQSRKFEMIIFENALSDERCLPEIMAPQCNRVVAASLLPNVKLGIVRNNVRTSGGIVSSFHVVNDEYAHYSLHGAHVHEKAPAVVRESIGLFDAYMELALTGEDAQALINQYAISHAKNVAAASN